MSLNYRRKFFKLCNVMSVSLKWFHGKIIILKSISRKNLLRLLIFYHHWQQITLIRYSKLLLSLLLVILKGLKGSK